MNRNTRTLLIDQAEAALRCWHGDDMTREQATALLPSWRWVVGLDDDMRAEVLDRFPSAEPPSVPGLDWLPGAPVTSKMSPAIELARRANPGAMLTAAALNAVADADDVLGADEPFCPACKHRMRMHSKDWGCNVWLHGNACPCVTGFAGFAPPEQTQADAATLVAEAVAVLDEPKVRHCSLSEKIAAANAEAAKFNAEFPPGTPVEYWSGAREGNGKIGHTEGEAFSSSSGQAVVFLDNASSYHALSHVRPLTAEQVAP